jgi:hypothetical membrane protein
MAVHLERPLMARNIRSRVVAFGRTEALAGMALASAGLIILMGIITAEATYPDTYTTFDNEISDLGATVPPNSIIRQPSAHIFNSTMMLSGLLLIAAAGALLRSQSKSTAVWLGLAGIGVLGVGIFPGNRAPMHGMFAMLAFICGGGAAIASGRSFRGTFGLVAAALGVIALGSLIVAMFGDLTPAMDHVGDGGLERWVAYPTVLWFVLFGGFLLGRNPESRP